MEESSSTPHQRRPRYKGKNPRRFDEKYKELNPERYIETVEKVKASGKTPAGQHIPIMVREILEVLAPQPGERAVDATLGYGGHAEAILKALVPGGKLVGLDQDSIEIAKTEARLRAGRFDEETFVTSRTNFAGIAQALAEEDWSDGADIILADLGVSSMQIDDPARGFSFKFDGPLDMRMNPAKGMAARDLLEDNADEPNAAKLGEALAGRCFDTTLQLAAAIREALPRYLEPDDAEMSVRRVFQAIRIAVNEELAVLDAFLAQLPFCLRRGGRVAILTFHSGEDRRVKKAFRSGMSDGVYSEISDNVVRASLAEVGRNPRASSAKLRWAVRAGV